MRLPINLKAINKQQQEQQQKFVILKSILLLKQEHAHLEVGISSLDHPPNINRDRYT